MTMSSPSAQAVVLLSGGLDSATCAAMAKAAGHEVIALSFRYGQRHHSEIEAARRVAAHVGAEGHHIIDIDLACFGDSALTDEIEVPKGRSEPEMSGGIPVTYVPARNTIFLSYGLALAEVNDAGHIYIGVNAIDYSGYPDCRPEYIEAFQRVTDLALQKTVEGRLRITIETPIIGMSKAEIIQAGTELGLDYSLTVSCYEADQHGRACGDCDSCQLRRRGFAEAGIADPTRYR